MTDKLREAGFTDAAFRRILERAMELEENRTERISEADLRIISRELGVSIESITRAIEESQEVAQPAPIAPAPVQTPWKVHAAALVAGVTGALLAGGSMALFRAHYVPTASVAVCAALQAYAVVIAARYSGPARQERFQLTNIALWSGTALGWLYLRGFIPEAIGDMILRSGFLSAVAGAATILLLDVSRNRTAHSDRTPSAGSWLDRAVAKRVAKLRSWLHLSSGAHESCRAAAEPGLV